jgi:hypothetical protein
MIVFEIIKMINRNRTYLVLLVLSLLNLIHANTGDFSNNPYYNHIEVDEDGVEWVEDNNRPRTAQLILS